MTGVFVNVAAIVAGAFIGFLFRSRISNEMGKRVEIALGYCVLVIGVRMALEYQNVLVLVACIAVGGVLGHALQLERRIASLAAKAQTLIVSGSGDDRFAKGLAMSSILFCTGAMAVVGSIQSGANSDHDVLFSKAILDGAINISFAAIYGLGVALSAIPVLLYQGSIALLASRLTFLNDPKILSDISGVGGILIMMIGVNLTRIKEVPVAEFLPSILLVLLVTAIY